MFDKNLAKAEKYNLITERQLEILKLVDSPII